MQLKLIQIFIFASTLPFIQCGSETNEVVPSDQPQKDSIEVVLVEDKISTDSIPFIPETVICEWDTYLRNEGLVNIQDVDSTILVELKYSTTDNFMETDVYGCLENCYLQPDVADRLVLCQNKLQELDSNLTLLLYDGLRPRLVQQFMWDLLDMPINEKTKFVSNPAKGSLHNFAAAVDITLYDKTTQQALDMGTPYDYIGVLAWPTKEPSLLKDSILTQQQVDNRILLRKVMKEGKFFNIQTEWWHFNACYRDKAKELYHIIEGDTSLLKI
jgi:D-alanyl-D-alanine dipeptidase